MKNLMILLVAATLVSPLAAQAAPSRGKGLLGGLMPKKKAEKKVEPTKAEPAKVEPAKVEPAKVEPAEKAPEIKKTERQAEVDRELAKRLAAAKAAAGGKELSYKEKAAIRKALQDENAKKK